ncbi:MAG: fumarylacetoacetate hydrolase family protein [Thermoplasmataceae archaeon]
MKVAEIILDGKQACAVETPSGLLKITDLIGTTIGKQDLSMRDLVNNGVLLAKLKHALTEIRKMDVLRRDEVRFLSPIGSPEKILCIGLNYRSHAMETGKEVPQFPTVFSKFNNAITANNEDIRMPDTVNKVDYEGELAIVIGKTGRNISAENALDHIFGYFPANDVSARDMQYRTSQWLMGKSIDGFFATGPYITTADEIPDPQGLNITTKLNGEVRQNSNTSKMIFSCSYIISYISKYMTLKPGDVISTGTPEGVILGMPEERQVWIKNGDVVEIKIDKLGVLTNRFIR